MVEVSARSSLLVEMVSRKTEPYATPNAEMDSTESAQYAGNTAPLNSEMMELSAINPAHMEEVLGMLSGMRMNATVTTLKVARSGEPSGTQDARRTSTTSLAVSAHQTALQV